MANGITEPDQFWARVAKRKRIRPHVSSPCWAWKGPINRGGYGMVTWRGKLRQVHRVAVEISGRAIPDGLCVLHRCDNPPCCNPEHLFFGTKAENNADARAKGRHVPGSGARKLTEDERIEALARRECGDTYQKIAADFGVNEATIYRLTRMSRQC